MRTDPGTLSPGEPAPLDWSGLVDEALRRRRQEGLTQKEHAALAGVSVPTLISFDRKETSLSLAKVLDILRAVGLVAERAPVSSQDAFVAAAERRWTELTSSFPEASPLRMPHGHFSFDYDIIGATVASHQDLHAFLRQAAAHKYSGWPPFWVPTRKDIRPYRFDDGVECWLGHDPESSLRDAAHSDFWRADLAGRLYLRRGYQEDATDALAPATVFDLTLPILRTAEVLLHADHLAQALAASGALPRADAEVRLRVRFAGLAGRDLKPWADPYRLLMASHRSRADKAGGTVACAAEQIRQRLPELVHAVLTPVYQHFDFFALPRALVEEELGKMVRQNP